MTATAADVAVAYANLRAALRQLPAEHQATVAHHADELDRRVAELVNADRPWPKITPTQLYQEQLEGWAELQEELELERYGERPVLDPDDYARR